jgi:hypothetical protein
MPRVDDKFRYYTWVGHNDIVDKMYLGSNIHWMRSGNFIIAPRRGNYCKNSMWMSLLFWPKEVL